MALAQQAITPHEQHQLQQHSQAPADSHAQPQAQLQLQAQPSSQPQGQASNHAPIPTPGAQGHKRVKVYELKNNDWHDRGTGFCSGQVMNSPISSPESLDARIIVIDEEDPARMLLETRITKDDGYQKQQDTLIVWTEVNTVDMALSFQEAEGCTSIWEFVSEIQTRLGQLAPDDALSDDLLDPAHPVVLPEPALGWTLDEITEGIRGASATPAMRDALVKFLMSPEQLYISKLGALVEQAEQAEATQDLHKLCNIMKHLILLNDTQIIEYVVRDEVIAGVVGALEYDPDFPSHRANHRAYLADECKFKEVVPITHPEIRKKIHYTNRLQYLKDVVLARILDDPTFSVLNSLIFFNQVEIVNHLQCNQIFLKDLFAIFGDDELDLGRKKEAVLFIRDCCAISKNVQAQHRAQLYQNFIRHPHGLFSVVTYALRHTDAAVRVAGTDILVSLIDHDADLVRGRCFKAIKDKTTPLTDTLIELLLVEADLGVKSQMADAIKILLDPSANNGRELMARQPNAQNAEFLAKQRGLNGAQAQGPAQQPQPPPVPPQTEAFIQAFYDDSAKRLFQPLKALEHRPSILNLTVHELSLLTQLVEMLMFFICQHSYKAKLFVLTEQLHGRIAQLLQCPQKHMKLTALKWFRTVIALRDEFHNRHLMQQNLLEPILALVEATMPRDNLLNSACLDFFECIKRESNKQLVVHLARLFRERLLRITYVDTFQEIVLRYDQMQAGYVPAPRADGADDSFTTQEDTPVRIPNGGQRFAGLREMDGDEEAYFNGDDDEEEGALPTEARADRVNGGLGASPVRPLVDYPEDDDEEPSPEQLDAEPDRLGSGKTKKRSSSSDTSSLPDADADADAMVVDAVEADVDDERGRRRGRDRRPVPVEGSPGLLQHRDVAPPESLAIKRRRDEEDEDELGKMMGSGAKRRNSSAASLLAGQAARLEMDGAAADLPGGEGDGGGGGRENGGVLPLLDLSSSPILPREEAPRHGHMLRRKGSLKTRNESVGGRFAIEPISLAAARAAVAEQHEEPPDGSEERTGDEVGNGNG